MDLIIGGRASGKSTQVLQWMAEAPQDEFRVLVCLTAELAMYWLGKSRELEYELASWQFVSVGELTHDAWSGVRLGYPRARMVLAWDDAEYFLRDYVSRHVHPYGSLGLVTMSAETVMALPGVSPVAARDTEAPSRAILGTDHPSGD